MTARAPLSCDDLAQALSAPLQPVLLNRYAGVDPVLGWFRVSAFPAFATSVDQLVQWIDDATASDLHLYRRRLRDLLDALATHHPTYLVPRRTAGNAPLVLVERGHDGLAEMALAWTEHDAADVVVAARSIVFLGHDDFGCTCVWDPAAPDAEPWVREQVARAGLFCVRPSAARETSVAT